MSQQDIEQVEKDVLYADHQVKRSEAACRARASIIGEHLEALGRALQEHPEAVTQIPEINAKHDYRQELQSVDLKQILSLCDEIRELANKRNAVNLRMAMLNL